MEFSKPGYIVVGTTPLMYAESVTMNANSDDKKVNTLLQGMTGFSDGAQFVEIDVKNAIPLSGYEYDATFITLSHATQTLSFNVAGVSTTVVGRMMNATTETTTEAPNSLAFKFVGRVSARTSL